MPRCNVNTQTGGLFHWKTRRIGDASQLTRAKVAAHAATTEFAIPPDDGGELNQDETGPTECLSNLPTIL